MIEQQVTEYKFTFLHQNHSTFKGVIKATSIENRDTQMLSLLANRYKRNLPLQSKYGNVVFEEQQGCGK